MARPTVSRLNTTPGFAPQVNQSPSLGVFAPLNVQTGPSGAEQLAQALGMVNKVAQPILADKIEKEGFARTSAGMADQQLNKVDVKRQAEDELYARGVKRVAVENTAIKAIADWQNRYETELDKKWSADDISADFDTFMQERLAPFLSDPEASKWAFERIAPAHTKVYQEHNAALAQQFRETTVSTVSDVIRTSLSNRQAINAEDMKNMLLAGGLSKGEAAKQYVNIVGALAVEGRAPKLIENLIPEKWADGTPGPRSTPELANALNQYRFYAEQGQKQDAQEATQLAEQAVEDGLLQITQIAARGNVGEAIKMLDEMVDKRLPLKRSDYTALVNFAEGRLDKARDNSFDPVALADFRLDLAEDPLSMTHSDLLRSVDRLVPSGKDGFIAAAQLMDDITAARRSAQLAETNPKAKAYRSSLVTRFRPDPGSTQSKKDRFAAGLQAFDLEFAESKDPEKAREAASKVFEATKDVDAAVTGNIAEDVKSLSAGKLGATDFATKYSTTDAIERIREAARKNEITQEQALTAARALQR